MRKVWKYWGKRVSAILMCLFLAAGIIGDSQIVGATTIDTNVSTGTDTNLTTNTGTTDTTDTTVKPKIYLNAETLTMSPATTYKLKLKGSSGTVKWKSSKSKVVEVDKKGKLTAKKKGTATITATNKGISYSCVVTVEYTTCKVSDGMKYTDVKGTFGYTGRWFKKKISGKNYVYTNTDGSAFYFKTTGTKYVNISFVSNVSAGMPYYAYSVDGKEMKRQKLNKSKINLGNTKTHYVRVVIDSMSEKEDRWTKEAGVGIKSITPVTKTGVVTAIEPQNETIAFYGDSITQGVRALSMALNPKGTSATHSYAWYCADKLNMVPYYAGYGGSGIIVPGSYNNLPNALSKFTVSRKAAQIDPAVVVVEHGTNDVLASAPQFTAEYKKALQQIHKKYPNAKVMAMIPFTGLHADEIRNAASGYKWCTVIETSSWNISYTDGLHPNTTGAKTVGANLAKKIKEKLK